MIGQIFVKMLFNDLAIFSLKTHLSLFFIVGIKIHMYNYCTYLLHMYYIFFFLFFNFTRFSFSIFIAAVGLN